MNTTEAILAKPKRMSGTRFYKVWENIKTRCNNKNWRDHSYYGGRGIRVCERWIPFAGFKTDMYESYLEHVNVYGEKDTSIDRIDVNGNYCKENCRWATKQEQARNLRKNLSYKGEMALDASVRLGGSVRMISSRLHVGWPVETAFTTPRGGKRHTPDEILSRPNNNP